MHATRLHAWVEQCARGASYCEWSVHRMYMSCVKYAIFNLLAKALSLDLIAVCS